MKVKIILLVINIFTVFFALIVGGRLPYFLLYTSLLIFLIPFIHCIMGKKFIKGEVILPQTEMVAGDEINIRYKFHNPLSFSFPILEFENNIAYRLTGKREKKVVFHMDKKGYHEGFTKVSCRRRGYYKSGKVNLYIRDIFNIYSLKKTIITPLSFKVYPKITPLKSFKIQVSQHMGELLAIDPLFQDHSSLSDLRVYQAGDPIKKIHWKVSAKNDELIVKNYEQRGDNEVVLIIDSNKESYFGDKENWIEDKIVDTSASIIDYCLKQNIKVSLYYEQKNQIIKTKGDHIGFLKRFMDEIVDFHPMENSLLQHNIEKLISFTNHGITLLVLTPSLNRKVGLQGIRMKMKNIIPVYIIVGDKKKNSMKWSQNKKVAKILEGESIPVYMVDVNQDIRDVLEAKYEKRA